MKKLFPVLFLLFCLHSAAQQISSKRWTDLFSYNNVLAIRDDGNRLVAATENGLFFYTPQTGEISKLSKTNGLHEVKISAFDFNGESGYGLIGYKSGALDVITPEGITYVVDIPLATGYMGDKKINHIFISGKTAVISSGYGVSLFNLERKEFGESAFFTNGAGFDEAKKAAIFNETVYVITTGGIKSKSLTANDFPVYSTWTPFKSGVYTNITATNAGLYYTGGNAVYTEAGTTVGAGFGEIQDLSVAGANVIVADANQISVFNESGQQLESLSGQTFTTGFYFNNELYGGTKTSGISNQSNEMIKPDGPYNNVSYKITMLGDKLFVSTGKRKDRLNNSNADPNNLGFYYFNGTKWYYSSFFLNNPPRLNVLDVAANPSDPAEVFFANYSQTTGQGIYKFRFNETIEDFEPQKYYNFNQTVGASYNRPAGLVFDENSLLLGTLAFYNGTTESAYFTYDRAADTFKFKSINVSEGAQKPLIAEGYIWYPVPRSTHLSVIDYKKTATFSDDQFFAVVKNNGLPSNAEGVISVVLDKTDDAWIGTDRGLRILRSAPSAVKNNPQAEPIIIEENGVGEELFRDTEILQIAVDNGNQKWVSTEGGGVFYLSADGTQTKLHFTKENSPLPTNSATDIKIDPKTGKVYFATLDGIVVYQGDVLEVTENFGDVLVYPNPVVHAQFKGNVKIRGLAAKTNIRITDAAGNLVHQAVARGGSYEWNLLNGRGTRVASGVYFVLMTNEDGTDTATAKIAVVN